MPARKPASKQLRQVITVPMTDALKRKVRKEARAKNQSQAAVVREVLTSALK